MHVQNARRRGLRLRYHVHPAQIVRFPLRRADTTKQLRQFAELLVFVL
jgi:hypothetical protein